MDSTRSSRVCPRPLARMMVRIFRNFSRPGFADCTRSSASRKRRSSLLFSRANERIRPGTTPAPDPLETAAKYAAFHAGLAQLYPEPLRTTCVDDTDFSSPGALAISMACKDSNENEELRDCTPECVKYFTDFGGDCELLEDAAKLQVVRAFNMGKLTSDETKALFAWYVLSSTDVCPHAPTLSLYRSIAHSLPQVRFLRSEELQRWVLTSNATRPCAVTLSLSLALRALLSRNCGCHRERHCRAPPGVQKRNRRAWRRVPGDDEEGGRRGEGDSQGRWVLTSTDVRSHIARPDSLTRATRFARSPDFMKKCDIKFVAKLGKSAEALLSTLPGSSSSAPSSSPSVSPPSSAVRATALAGVTFFFAALV